MNSPSTESRLIGRLATALEGVPGFIAHQIAQYRELYDLTNDDISRELGITPEMLPLLMLCRNPRSEARADDVSLLAAYSGASAEKLSWLLFEVHRFSEEE